jgi:hypothetical protein
MWLKKEPLYFIVNYWIKCNEAYSASLQSMRFEVYPKKWMRQLVFKFIRYDTIRQKSC